MSLATSTEPVSTSTSPVLPEALQRAMGRVNEIGSLPEITTRIVSVVEDPKSTARDMHDIVKNDPALATKILKVVNSAFYGLPSQIASLDRAIVMLGLSAVKNIALAASLSRLFKGGEVSETFTAKDLWQHSIAVGVCARQISKAISSQSEEAFVAGLVHDMGLLVEFQLFPDKLRSVVDRCEQTQEDFCAVERDAIGADHQAFGAALAARWKFPPALRSAIAYHHDTSTLQPDFKRFVTVIQMADRVCCGARHGFWLTAAVDCTVPEDMLALVGLTAEKLKQIEESLPEKIEETQAIFSEA